MPSINSRKTFLNNGIYHAYNRGIDKRDIFLDKQDYKMFLAFLKYYLLDPEILKHDLQGSDPSRVVRRNFYKKIDLFGYCLMPNHFHLLLRQENESDMTEFMRCIITNYVMYFNRKYERSGFLFQGVYKAILIDTDEYVLQLSRYIHLNPFDLQGSDPSRTLSEYDYSSYQDYLGLRQTGWVKPEFVLGTFSDDSGSSRSKEYRNFVEETVIDAGKVLGRLAID